MAQIIGQAKVKISGDILETDGSCTLETGGVSREAVEGDNRAGDFREKPNASKLEVSVLMTPGVSLASYQRVAGETITVEFDNGLAWLIAGGYCAEVPSISQSDGKGKLTFMGQPAQELR